MVTIITILFAHNPKKGSDIFPTLPLCCFMGLNDSFKDGFRSGITLKLRHVSQWAGFHKALRFILKDDK